MKERFDGDSGKRRLIEALLQQKIIEHDPEIAKAFAEAGHLLDLDAATKLIEQGASDNDIYLLIDGEVHVVVNDRLVAKRGPGESIGEMVAADSSARRSATIVAAKPCCVLKTDETTFHAIAEKFPQIWRPITKVLAARLREREKFHRPPNPTPVLFIGSSVEGLAVAQEIPKGLKHDPVVPRPWCTPGLFSAGGVSIDELLKEVDASDFAAFVFGPDDKITSRHVDYAAPRDNVVFELGLFMGRLDRDRTFIIKEQRTDVKIPTDLLGVTPITYVEKPGQDLPTMMAPVCSELRDAIKKLGLR